MSVCCSSTVSPSTCAMASVSTSLLLALIVTFSCPGLDATSKGLRCPLTCQCTGNYSNSTVTCDNSYLTRIPQLPFGTTKAIIVGNNITRLHDNAFSGLNKLRIMRINMNNIQAIDEGAFRGLNSLEMLYLDEEWLSSFENGVFRFFCNLSRISMRVKGVVIPQAELCLVKSLRILKLAKFHFPSARFRQCFEQLTVLSTLSLNYVQQSNISRATFYPFRGSLTELHLINCGLRRLRVDMFNDLSKLIVLDLTQNEITDLPSDIFASLTRLTQLDIAGNKLKVISAALLRPLRSLIRLNIGDNTNVNITFGEQFLNMTRLQRIGLNGIKMSSLNNDTFRHLRNSPVVEVDMSTCSLRTISRGAFLPLRNVTILSLNSNPLNESVLHDAFYGLHGAPLRILRMRNCLISVIKRGSLHNLRTVTTLDLVGNKIGVIDDYAFEDLIMLSRLFLDKNRFVELPSTKRLGISPGLTSLSISSNYIKEVNQESLRGYDNLTYLNLADNDIGEISANTFTPTPRLEILYLSNNRIYYIPLGSFNSLPYLRELSLDNNAFAMSGAFQVCCVVFAI